MSDNLSWQLVPDRLLAGWLAGKSLGLIANQLERTGALSVLASSLPGIRDVLVLGHLRALVDEGRFDRIIVDGPATGRARELFRSPRLLAEVVSEGPVADQAARADDLLSDASKTAIALVTLAEDTPVSETIELAFDLEDDPGVRLGGIVINRVISPLQTKKKLAGVTAAVLGPRLAHEQEQIDRVTAELPVEQWLLNDVAGGIGHADDIALALNTARNDSQIEPTHGDETDWPMVKPGAMPADLFDAEIIVTAGTGGVCLLYTSDAADE